MLQTEYNIACVPILRAAETSSFIGNKTTLFPVAFYLYFLTIDAAINYRISTSSLPALPAAETGSLSRGRGLGRGQQAKGLFAGIRKCSIFNCRINRVSCHNACIACGSPFCLHFNSIHYIFYTQTPNQPTLFCLVSSISQRSSFSSSCISISSARVCSRAAFS